MVPTGWKDDGTHLTAPNGNSVVLAFRRHILTHGWAPDDWPIESEHYERFIDITNPFVGDGLVQFFRKSILARQQDSNQVLELWSGAIALEWRRRADSKAETTSRPSLVTVHGRHPNASNAARLMTTQSNYAPLESVYHLPHASELPTLNLLAESTKPNSERLASLEKQVHLLISGLGAGTKPNEVARTIQDRAEMIATDPKEFQLQNRPLSDPKILIRWLVLLIALLFGDSVAWAISTLIHQQTMLSLPLLTLGTVALSSFFFLLLTLRPRP